MEAIKNYLEAMFASMPNTEAVRKAKDELYAMMEDKYNELIEEGKSENEAVGTVISEFGNLDELAGDLGLEEEVKQEKEFKQEANLRYITFDEVKKYLDKVVVNSKRTALGVFLFIISVEFPIISDAMGLGDAVGVLGMFACVGAGIGLLVYESTQMEEYRFIKKSKCQVDMMTTSYVADAKRKFEPTYSTMLTVGILLCALCWLPSAVLSEFPILDDLCGVSLFLLLGIGVYLLIYSDEVKGSYKRILAMNDTNTISGNYGAWDAEANRSRKYINSTVATIMSVYKPTVTAIYLIWSFLTFNWLITWIIWPIAAIIEKIINTNLTVED